MSALSRCPRMVTLRSLCALLSAVALVFPGALHAGSATEYFDDACNELCPGVVDKGGGSGWTTPWLAACTGFGPRCCPGNLSYTGPGYCSEGNGPGGNYVYHNGGSYRQLAQSIDGLAYVSFLVRRATASQEIMIGQSAGCSTAPFLAGVVNGVATIRMYVGGQLYVADGGPQLPYDNAHLVVARFQFNYNAAGHDTISVWVNPQNLDQGEAGLGAPAASLGGHDVASSWGTVLVQQSGPGDLDAIRINYSSEDSPASLQDVLGCTCQFTLSNTSCALLGGPGVPGGVLVSFDEIVTPGAVSADTLSVTWSDLERIRTIHADPDTINFVFPSNPVLFWTLFFNGTFIGEIELTFGYSDEDLLPFIDESGLVIYHFEDNQWVALPVVARDLAENTITVRTSSLSPFALGDTPLSSVPEGQSSRTRGRIEVLRLAGAATQVWFSCEGCGAAQLELFDVSGRRVGEVFHGSVPSGGKRLWIDHTALGVASGFFFLRLSDSGQTLATARLAMTP